ncbi:MAG: stage V sporulation protein D [Oscillibacter sp. CAG:241_62_21]|nr:MAG: stage V sporulation protein D [Oscillibacter sp. CAG:241_62_21]
MFNRRKRKTRRPQPQASPATDRNTEFYARQATRTVRRRTFWLMLVLGILAFVVLFFKLYDLQIIQHKQMQTRALDQQTSQTVVSAFRGTIYDRNGSQLAVSVSAEDVVMSPFHMKKQRDEEAERLEKIRQENAQLAEGEKKKSVDTIVLWDYDSLAAKLADILDLSQDDIRERMNNTNSQYELLAKKVDEDTADQIRQLINDLNIEGLDLVATSRRVYPYGSLASHILGFVGAENTGLYGLESRYDQYLQGQSGLVVSAKDVKGNPLPYEYEQYFAAQSGQDVVLTLDANVQYYLEKYVGEMADKYGAENGATGIVMDVKTGGILGMVSYPTYDLNNAFTVQNDQFKKDLTDTSDQLLKQWRNKALNDTYEPGSTFKILTMSAAMEEGLINMNTTYTCTGGIHVSDATIHCTGTHGTQTLKEAAAHSCNPAFITFGLQLGNEKFYEYMNDFGLMSGTGIDLDGEATGVFASPESFTQLDLACYAFGQNFNVTPIALIAAQAACVNGGYLHTPYLVEQIVDSDGSITYQHDTTPVRQVVSEETSAHVRECLEYVVSDGTGRNGQVKGYRVGGKTGTADKGQTGDLVVSFVSFAPADDPQVIILVTMDTPSRSAGTSVSGGSMVAPVNSKIMADILPYLGIEPTYSAEELLGADTTVPYVIGSSVEDAKSRVESRGFTCKVVGTGNTITDQTPAGGAVIPGKSTVILYAGAEKPNTMYTVPQLVGKTAAEANVAATNAGLLVRFSGATQTTSGNIRVLSQSLEAGQQVPAGTVITVQLGDTNMSD